MLYEAELFISSSALLSLEPYDASALLRLASLFRFTSKLAEARRERLAATLEHVLGALRACGIDDAVFASRDGVPCFVDRVGRGQDIDDLAEPASEAPIDFEVLHLFVRETHVDAQEAGDPYRGEGTSERPQLQLAVDVEIHRVVPFDGYPLRLRVHGLINELRATPDESWDALAQRTAHYITARFPERRIHGHDDVPREFTRRVEALAQALMAKLGAGRIDTAIRSAIVVPRHSREGTLEELPARFAAGSFARLPGLEDPLRYLFAWPEVHVGVAYQQMLVLDGRGRRMLATGPSPVAATGPGQTLMGCPAYTLAPENPPLDLPVPDLLCFSGHEWDAEVRQDLLLTPGTRCEGLDGCAALLAHERRKFDCGARGPARATSTGAGSGSVASGRGFPGELSF